MFSSFGRLKLLQPVAGESWVDVTALALYHSGKPYSDRALKGAKALYANTDSRLHHEVIHDHITGE